MITASEWCKRLALGGWLCGSICAAIGSPTPAGAWVESLDGAGVAHSLAIGANGDVLAVGGRALPGEPEHLVATRRDGSSGAERWLTELGGGVGGSLVLDDAGNAIVGVRSKNGTVTSVLKLDGATGVVKWTAKARKTRGDGPVQIGFALNGDVYVTFSKPVASGANKTTVQRLARDSGATVWKKKLAGPDPLALAADAQADVLVVASGDGQSSLLAKLARSNGAPVWQRSIPIGPDVVLATMPSRDVLVAGRVHLSNGSESTGVLALDAATGNERWRYLAGAGMTARVASSASGDVFLAVDVDVAVADAGPPGAEPQTIRSVAITRISGSTGAKTWTKTLSDPTGLDCGASALVIGSGNAPILGGCSTSRGGEPGFQIMRLRPDNGRVVWQRALPGPAVPAESLAQPVRALALDASGAVAGAGAATEPGGASRFTLVKWSDADGDDLLGAADRACREAISTEGQNLLLTTLQALEGCRERINSGFLQLEPEACASEQATKRTIDRVRLRTRESIAKKCPAGLPAGVSCATGLDGLVAAGGASGCLVESHDAVADALVDLAYGAVLTGQPTSVLACQAATGTAGRRLVTALATALLDCRGRGVQTTDACLSDPGYLADVGTAAKAARTRIRGACTDADLAALSACADKLDTMVAPSLDGGCLLEASALGAEATFRAERN
jgi:outer membrane protein assembly factor BamB